MRPVPLRSIRAVCVAAALAVTSLTAALADPGLAGAAPAARPAEAAAAAVPARRPRPSPTPTLTSTTPTPAPTVIAAPAPCGGEVVSKPDGTAWLCSFDDEFDGTALDRTKWTVQTTAASGYHAGGACFMDSPNNVAVSGGTLKLTARQESAPFTCTDPVHGNWTAQYTSGTVNGFGKFAQTYGRFEVRAKLPAATVAGLQETLWLWPVDQFKYGLWPASGEIDFAEVYSKYAGWNVPYLHYGVVQSTVDWTTNTNVYTALPAPYNQPGMDCQITVGGFNDYTVIWQPGQIVIQVNGQNCIIDNYSASNVAPPAPFDQPFFLALTQALGVGSNAFVAGVTPLPATTEVDYVRIWR